MKEKSVYICLFWICNSDNFVSDKSLSNTIKKSAKYQNLCMKKFLPNFQIYTFPNF